MEAVECGAAALGIVLGYYGRFVPLDELRAAAGVSRDGSKAINVVKAGKQYGLRGAGRRMELEDLAALQRPVILWWAFDHFVVFEGYTGQKARINDPASGRRSVPMEEFDAMFTGIVIDLEPTPAFRKGGHGFRPLPAIGARLRRYRIGLLQAVLAGFLATVPGLVTAGFVSIFVDDVLGRGDRSLLLPLLVGVALATGLRFGATKIQQRQLLRMQIALANESADSFLWRVIRAPMEFYGQRFTADLSLRMNSNTTLAQVVSGLLAGVFISALTALVYAVVMMVFSWQLALLVFVLTTANVAAMRLVVKKRRTASEVLLKYQAELGNTTYSGVRTIETLKATSSETFYFGKWAGEQARVQDAENSLAKPGIFLNAVPVTVDAVIAAVVIVVGGFQVLSGDLSLGELVAFQSLALFFTAPVRAIVNSASTIQDVGVQVERIDDVLKQDLDERFTAQGPSLDEWDGDALSGAIELRNVTFGYSPLEPPLISGLDLIVGPGRSVALVGPSGAGKSTIVRLVTGLLHPWSGEVLFDGHPARDIPVALLTESLAVVEQRISLFAGTISDNLTLWDDSIDPETVEEAARDARIHDVIVARAGGYQARIDEGGRNWSGGERQRLEIARALAHTPRLLVLDEATSALDPVTELEVSESIARRPHSVLVVAHRLSTIRDADEIIVLDKGKVVERGGHNELMAARGTYFRLVGEGGDVGA